ncbi:hypothetical protein CA850_14405 [Micromonospora echinospora]|uniref:Asp-tRNAAsn/Glu-tRNAGln amidotransferase A subunit n=1 Tax=Micromonospora echinospora TaxID=1877 RepID=A0A1C4ZA67_MICEC|nr:amidase [Micromonospora echinospora]OZV80538.1 hypothetical protein CA850_14405 [Micromonospora echinospora]SCF29838.1 Asp-tRNAAsn/Glu-tRNAGln amidotransferase A subunit [Micromonospora echinospora]
MSRAAALRYLDRALVAPPDERAVPLLLGPVAGRDTALADAGLDRATWSEARRAWVAHADRLTRALRWVDPLADHGGWTVTVKDTIDVAGVPTSLGHAVHRHHPAVTADAAARLREIGLSVVGKAYATELNIGPPDQALNPAFPDLSPGGSSTGSAVSVAAGISDYALATDVLGSARWPAANCGIAGLRVSWHPARLAGVLPVSPTQDSIGLMARTVEDLRLLWLRAPVAPLPHRGHTGRPVVATVRNAASAAPPMAGAQERVVDVLRDLGFTVREIELPEAMWSARELAWELCAADVAEVVAETEARLGMTISATARASLREAVTAGRHRELHDAQREFRAAMPTFLDKTGVDVMLLPVSPSPPKRVVDRAGRPTLPKPADADYTDRIGYTPIASFAGMPALVLPAVVDDELGPLAVQFVGRAGGEGALLDLGVAVEHRLGVSATIAARVATTLTGRWPC